MDRRKFSAGLISTGLASPMLIRPKPALATIQQNEWPNVVDPFGLMRVFLIGSITLQLTWFIMVFGTVLWGLDLRGRQRQYPANRLNTSKIPFLGGVTRPTLATRFNAATFLGTVVLWNSILFLVLRNQLVAPPVRFLASNRNFEWDVDDKFKRVNLAEVPTVAQLLGLPPVGPAFLNQDNELLVILRPSVIEPQFDY